MGDYLTSEEESLLENHGMMRKMRDPEKYMKGRVTRYSGALRADAVRKALFMNGLVPGAIAAKNNYKAGWGDPKDGSDPDMIKRMKSAARDSDPSVSADLARLDELKAKKDLTPGEAKEYKALYARFKKGFSKSAKGIYSAAASSRKADMRKARTVEETYYSGYLTEQEYILIEKPWVSIGTDKPDVYTGDPEKIEPRYGMDGNMYGVTPEKKPVRFVSPDDSVQSRMDGGPNGDTLYAKYFADAAGKISAKYPNAGNNAVSGAIHKLDARIVASGDARPWDKPKSGK